MTPQQSRIASFILAGAELLAKCDKVAIHSAGTASMQLGPRTAIVAADNMGLGVFLFEQQGDKMLHHSDIDSPSIEAALASVSTWLHGEVAL